MTTYNYKNYFIDNQSSTNIFIASITTGLARLMLYDKLDYLQDKVLYFHTDCIIYNNDGSKTALRLVTTLGCLTDELSGDVITQFVSPGP